jgi:Domain of unknown function (DUF4386)
MNRKLTATAIITAAVLTNVGFTMLGSSFNYPDVLKEPTADILARFREHQSGVTFWFTILAVSAALFAPIAIGVGKLRSDRTMRLATRAGIAAAIVQTIGLARWPILVPGYAHDATSTNPNVVSSAHDHFHTAHVVLGNIIGETLGYLLTAAWTLLVVISLGTRFAGRAFRIVGGMSAAMIAVGVFSPLDLAAIDTVNFAGYVLWSVWLIWLAIRVVRGDRPTMKCRPALSGDSSSSSDSPTPQSNSNDNAVPGLRRAAFTSYAINHRLSGPISAMGGRCCIVVVSPDTRFESHQRLTICCA